MIVHLPETDAWREFVRTQRPPDWHPDEAVNPFVYHGLQGVAGFRSDGMYHYCPRRFVAIYLGIEFPPCDWDSEHYCLRGRWLLLRPSFRFDGASGPAIDGVGNLLASAVHDALCHAASRKVPGITYAKADALYRAVAIAQGAGKVRMWNQWFWLRTCGWAYRLFHA